MATYTTTADANGDFAINFDTTYNGGQKINVESDKDGVTREIEIFAPSQYQEIPDANVATWSGRTQREKNKDTVSPFDYGATGVVGTSTDSLYPTDDIFPSDDLFSGASDDTQAFARLEAEHTGRIVDLQGFSFNVESAPVKNIYIGGNWIVDGKEIKANGVLLSNKAKLFDVKTCVDDKASSLYRVLYANGRGGARTIQSVAQDNEGYLYSNHNTQVDGNTTVVSVLNKYPLNSPLLMPSIDFMSPEDRLGHQGLAVLHSKKEEEKKLFTTSSDVGSGTQNHPDFDYTVGSGYGVVSFNWKSDTEGDIEKPIQYRVFQSYLVSGSSTTPTITTDGKWLIVRRAPSGQNGPQYFRVFSTDLFNEAEDTDVSNKYSHEFSINVSSLLESGDTIHSLSGFCSDGNHLYAVLAGYREPVSQPKYLLSCSLLGDDIECAKGDLFENIEADSGVAPTFLETEGLSIIEINGAKLLSCVVVSNGAEYMNGRRYSALYHLGSETEREIKNFKGYNLYTTEVNLPVTCKLDKTIVNGVQLGEALIFDNNTRGTGDSFRFLRNGIVGLKCYQSTTNVALTAPTGNHNLVFGATPYDGSEESSSWNWSVIRTGMLVPYRDNTYEIGEIGKKVKKIYTHNLQVSSLSVFADNATAKTGGLTVGDVYRTATGQLMIVY